MVSSTSPRTPAAGSGRAPGSSTIAGVRSRYAKIRANSASEVCTSSATRSRLTIGNSSRVCSVVNATSVPADSSPLLPPAVSPATR